jgi:serine protease inhibitor
LGLGEIFDESKANFRGMIQIGSNENLYVSKVIQKAFIEVNEEGAEAAASTGKFIIYVPTLACWVLCAFSLVVTGVHVDHIVYFLIIIYLNNVLIMIAPWDRKK